MVIKILSERVNGSRARWIWGLSLLFSEFCLARGSRGDTGEDFFSGVMAVVLSIGAFVYLLTLFEGKKEDASDWGWNDWLFQILGHGIVSLFAAIPFMFAFGLFGMKFSSIMASWPILAAILTIVMIYLKCIKPDKERP